MHELQGLAELIDQCGAEGELGVCGGGQQQRGASGREDGRHGATCFAHQRLEARGLAARLPVARAAIGKKVGHGLTGQPLVAVGAGRRLCQPKSGQCASRRGVIAQGGHVAGAQLCAGGGARRSAAGAAWELATRRLVTHRGRRRGRLRRTEERGERMQSHVRQGAM